MASAYDTWLTSAPGPQEQIYSAAEVLADEKARIELCSDMLGDEDLDPEEIAQLWNGHVDDLDARLIRFGMRVMQLVNARAEARAHEMEIQAIAESEKARMDQECNRGGGSDGYF